MNGQFVNFPDDGDWVDSGEGGLFVMIVVPEPEGWSNNCHVDVSVVSAIRMTEPDVVVYPYDSRKMWAPYDFQERQREWNTEKRILERAKADGDQEAVRWATRAWAPDNISVAMLAAVHAGSTSLSLRSGATGYWYATEADLNDAGKVVWAALKGAYGIDPVLVTFLDT